MSEQKKKKLELNSNNPKSCTELRETKWIWKIWKSSNNIEKQNEKTLHWYNEKKQDFLILFNFLNTCLIF